MVKDKPGEYTFLAELDDSVVDLISIEAAQPNLKLSVFAKLPSKTIVLGVIDLGDMAIETPEAVASRTKEALKYLPRGIAFAKLQAMTQGVEMAKESLV